MLTLIHGNDVSSSRKFYLDKKQEFAHPLQLNGETLMPSDLASNLASQGLFENKKVIFIEELLSKRKAGAELNKILEYLKSNHKQAEIFIWEGKELTKNLVLKFKSHTVKMFKYPLIIFAFLDSLKPKNTQSLILYFHQAMKSMEVEVIVFMMIRQFRLLLSVKDDSNEQIEEARLLAPWQKSKLFSQADKFSFDQLINLYHKLFMIDSGHKTGKLYTPLSTAIDFFLLDI